MKHILLSVPVLTLLFLAILFLQSGLDKVFNYKANKEWIDSHFAKSPLAAVSGLLMFLITILETAAGALCAVGIVTLVGYADPEIGLYGAQLSALSIIALFFGQRLAQDYAGAATLTTYFLIAMVAMYSLWQL